MLKPFGPAQLIDGSLGSEADERGRIRVFCYLQPKHLGQGLVSAAPHVAGNMPSLQHTDKGIKVDVSVGL